jgi:hypothetical protein
LDEFPAIDWILILNINRTYRNWVLNIVLIHIHIHINIHINIHIHIHIHINIHIHIHMHILQLLLPQACLSGLFLLFNASRPLQITMHHHWNASSKSHRIFWRRGSRNFFSICLNSFTIIAFSIRALSIFFRNSFLLLDPEYFSQKQMLPRFRFAFCDIETSESSRSGTFCSNIGDKCIISKSFVMILPIVLYNPFQSLDPLLIDWN